MDSTTRLRKKVAEWQGRCASLVEISKSYASGSETWSVYQRLLDLAAEIRDYREEKEYGKV